MHEYDTVLKSLLQDPNNLFFERITGAKIGRWLNVELPEVTQPRVDLLGETVDGQRLLGIELQSANDSRMPLRMAEYSLRVYRLHERFPEQYVPYVGNAPMTMTSELLGPRIYCRYEIIDIRDIDENWLLNSPFDADNILAILTNHKDRRDTIRRILARIATLEGGARELAFRKLIILAGLRQLKETILTEVEDMPIIVDSTMDPEMGPAIEFWREELWRRQGERNILRRQIGKRFGDLPAWVDERLRDLSTRELEELSLRFLDAVSLDDLFGL